MTDIQTQCMVQGVSYNNLIKRYLLRPKEVMKSIKEFGKRLYNLLMPFFRKLYEKLTSYGYYSKY